MERVQFLRLVRLRQGLFYLQQHRIRSTQHHRIRSNSVVRGSEWQATLLTATKIQLPNLGRSFSGRSALGRSWAGVQWQHVDDREFLNRQGETDHPSDRIDTFD